MLPSYPQVSTVSLACLHITFWFLAPSFRDLNVFFYLHGIMFLGHTLAVPTVNVVVKLLYEFGQRGPCDSTTLFFVFELCVLTMPFRLPPPSRRPLTVSRPGLRLATSTQRRHLLLAGFCP